MKATFFILAFFLISIPAKAQGLSGAAGITSSINMGEIGPASIFKSNFTVGDRFRFENDFQFSTMDKYTGDGWFVLDGVGVLIFPSKESGFFIAGGADYRHRNGGLWAKDSIRVGGSIGYEKDNSQMRISVKDKIITFTDAIKYYPYFEFLVRGDYPIQNSKWRLGVETEFGFFGYVEKSNKRNALYVNAVLGLAYKWP